MGLWFHFPDDLEFFAQCICFHDAQRREVMDLVAALSKQRSRMYTLADFGDNKRTVADFD